MLRWLLRCRAPLIAAGLCGALSACSTQRDQELRLSEALGRARADAAFHAARATALEARVARLEQRVASNTASSPNEERALWSRLDQLIAQNQRLLTERAAPSNDLAHAPEAARTPQPAAVSAPKTTPEEQVRVLLERLRTRPAGFNGATREQEQALRVLLRPERQLDAESPWPELSTAHPLRRPLDTELPWY